MDILGELFVTFLVLDLYNSESPISLVACVLHEMNLGNMPLGYWLVLENYA